MAQASQGEETRWEAPCHCAEMSPLLHRGLRPPSVQRNLHRPRLPPKVLHEPNPHPVGRLLCGRDGVRCFPSYLELLCIRAERRFQSPEDVVVYVETKSRPDNQNDEINLIKAAADRPWVWLYSHPFHISSLVRCLHQKTDLMEL